MGVARGKVSVYGTGFVMRFECGASLFRGASDENIGFAGEVGEGLTGAGAEWAGFWGCGLRGGECGRTECG